jgi:hypothetical protein
VARRILAVALLVLVGLHLFPPSAGDPHMLIAGFLPWDLAYHLAWILAAALVVIYMTGAPWPDDPPPARQPPPSPSGGDDA